MRITDAAVNVAYDALRDHMNGPGAYSGVAFSTEGIRAALEAAAPLLITATPESRSSDD